MPMRTLRDMERYRIQKEYSLYLWGRIILFRRINPPLIVIKKVYFT